MEEGRNTHNIYSFQHRKWLIKLSLHVLNVQNLELRLYALNALKTALLLDVDTAKNAIIAGTQFNIQKLLLKVMK